jgi:N-acetylglutamate synthase-like GNAT family acetyltransferase
MDILDGNTPEFFLPEDREPLAAFLARLPGPYLVVEKPGGIVACGGWAMNTDGIADLTWGMVRRESQRCRIGRMLLRHRLASVRTEASASRARVRTTQLVQGFFIREGFSVVEVVPQGFGPPLDHVTMELRLRLPEG